MKKYKAYLDEEEYNSCNNKSISYCGECGGQIIGCQVHGYVECHEDSCSRIGAMLGEDVKENCTVIPLEKDG